MQAKPLIIPALIAALAAATALPHTATAADDWHARCTPDDPAEKTTSVAVYSEPAETLRIAPYHSNVETVLALSFERNGTIKNAGLGFTSLILKGGNLDWTGRVSSTHLYGRFSAGAAGYFEVRRADPFPNGTQFILFTEPHKAYEIIKLSNYFKVTIPMHGGPGGYEYKFRGEELAEIVQNQINECNW